MLHYCIYVFNRTLSYNPDHLKVDWTPKWSINRSRSIVHNGCFILAKIYHINIQWHPVYSSFIYIHRYCKFKITTQTWYFESLNNIYQWKSSFWSHFRKSFCSLKSHQNCSDFSTFHHDVDQVSSSYYQYSCVIPFLIYCENIGWTFCPRHT